MTRPPEPEIVTAYRATTKVEPPKVCHTCDHYQQNGLCREFGETVPEAFAAAPDVCQLWEEELPF